MIKKIYFDWHECEEEVCGDISFGQISYYDECDEKIDVHNIDNISKEDFIKLYSLQREYNRVAYVEWGII